MLAHASTLNAAPILEIIAYHGWGFDASCWQPWQSQFEQSGWQFKAFDRGYWQHSIQPEFAPHAQSKIVMVHSYGLHFCPIQQLQQANLLVIFSSFAEFHPSSARLRQRSKQMLQQMIDQFRLHPQQVLSNFWAKCDHPSIWQGTIAADFDFDLLLHDLNQLQTASIDLTLVTLPQILMLQGYQDQIVPPARAAELAHQLSVQPQLIQAGHGLPFTHFERCWSILSAYLKLG